MTIVSYPWNILSLLNNTWSQLFLIRTRNGITFKWNINFIQVESDFIVFWLSEIESLERIKNRRKKIWVCWKLHRIIEIIMWKLIRTADVFCMAEKFSKLNLMPLVGVGILQVSPVPPNSHCFIPGPLYSWLHLPGPWSYLRLIQDDLVWCYPVSTGPWLVSATL